MQPGFKDALDAHFMALAFFSRVLYIVAMGLGIEPPVTTHILFSLNYEVSTLEVGVIDLNSDNITQRHLVSTSTSLPPPPANQKALQLKKEAAKRRVDALLKVIRDFNVKQFEENHSFKIGYCGEFLNALR